MRRFMSAFLLAASLLTGTLALSGCIVVPPRHHGHATGYDGRDHHHDRDRHHDHDHDHWH
ncbi:MAG: hypothetical protein ACYC0F_16665 [Rhodanobacter sp.]